METLTEIKTKIFNKFMDEDEANIIIVAKNSFSMYMRFFNVGFDAGYKEGLMNSEPEDGAILTNPESEPE